MEKYTVASGSFEIANKIEWQNNRQIYNVLRCSEQRSHLTLPLEPSEETSLWTLEGN